MLWLLPPWANISISIDSNKAIWEGTAVMWDYLGKGIALKYEN